MKWEDRKRSSHVEDRRSRPSTGMRLGKRGGVIGLIAVFAGLYFGVLDMSDVTRLLSNQSSAPTAPYTESADEYKISQLASVVLAETEETWGEIFARSNQRYQAPVLVLYRGSTQTQCGAGKSAMGPFYCPMDQKIYLDLSFYDEMREQLQAGGEFAFAYVIAHEVGHHVQNLWGITQATQRAQGHAHTKAQQNQISVKVELQADCFAGIWAHSMKNRALLESGDVEEAFRAAASVGDDRLQNASHGHVVPDSFTHGSSDDRLMWFQKGWQTGDVAQCNTL